MSAYLYGGLGVVILFMGIANWGQSKHIGALVVEKKALQSEFDTAVAANAEQARTIDDLKAANDKWAGRAQKAEKAHAEVLDALSKANLARDKAQTAMRLREREDRASKECQMVLSEDIARSCPDIAADMLQRAK